MIRLLHLDVVSAIKSRIEVADELVVGHVGCLTIKYIENNHHRMNSTRLQSMWHQAMSIRMAQ
jgi:hypothetical protein